jgi:maleylacetoacetate isomerase
MYGFWRSAASFRVRTALNLKALSFEEVMIDIDNGGQATATYRGINPQMVVPSLVIDGGSPLTQSMAIMEYLEETHPSPPLLPSDAAGRARVRSLALLWAADHHPLIVPRIRQYLKEELGQDDSTRVAWVRHWFREGLVMGERRLANELGTARFCHGDTPTLADLCLVSQALGARGFKVDFSDLPHTTRIVAHCMTIDAFDRAAPLRQPGAPSAH